MEGDTLEGEGGIAEDDTVLEGPVDVESDRLGLWRVVLTVRVGSCDSRDENLRNIGVERERGRWSSREVVSFCLK